MKKKGLLKILPYLIFSTAIAVLMVFSACDMAQDFDQKQIQTEDETESGLSGRAVSTITEINTFLLYPNVNYQGTPVELKLIQESNGKRYVYQIRNSRWYLIDCSQVNFTVRSVSWDRASASIFLFDHYGRTGGLNHVHWMKSAGDVPEEFVNVKSLILVPMAEHIKAQDVYISTCLSETSDRYWKLDHDSDDAIKPSAVGKSNGDVFYMRFVDENKMFFTLSAPNDNDSSTRVCADMNKGSHAPLHANRSEYNYWELFRITDKDEYADGRMLIRFASVSNAQLVYSFGPNYPISGYRSGGPTIQSTFFWVVPK